MAKLGLSGRVAQMKKDRAIDYTEVIGNSDIADELQLMYECLTKLSVMIYNWIPNIREVGSFEELCSKEIGEDEDKLCLKNLQRIQRIMGFSVEHKSFGEFITNQEAVIKLVKEIRK